MKVLMINVVCGIRSTGRICTDLAKALEEQGHEVKIAYGRENVPEQFQKYAVKIGSDLDVKLHGLKARLLDGAGFGSKAATKRFIKWVEEYDPDVIHLHNIHGYYINVEILFKYLKKSRKKVIWTLHDCWSFTGHCCYYTSVECKKWKNKCYDCPQKHVYPESIIVDKSEDNYNKKRMIFTSLPSMELVTPSKWLKSEVESSFLGKYSVRAISNGIDLAVFSPTVNNFKKNNSIKKMLLGVASTWEKRKGLDDFIQLRALLPSEYTIVLVGLSNEQIANLPEGIWGLERTDSLNKLVELYSSADVFLNLSVEETMGLTTVEAMACGTPVIVYDSTALPEVVEQWSGEIVAPNDLCGVIDAIKRIEQNINSYRPEKTALKYNNKDKYGEYLNLYENIVKN